MTRSRPPRVKRAGASRKKPADPNACCPQWDAFPEASRTWPWRVVHRFAHSRITFSADTVAVKANVNTDIARGVVREALNYGWIAGYGPTGIYVGKLPTFPREAA